MGYVAVILLAHKKKKKSQLKIQNINEMEKKKTGFLCKIKAAYIKKITFF